MDVLPAENEEQMTLCAWSFVILENKTIEGSLFSLELVRKSVASTSALLRSVARFRPFVER